MLFYRDDFNCNQFLFAHLPIQEHLDFELVRLPDSEGSRICNNIITCDWSWDTQDQLPTRATVVPVICASDQSQFTNFSGDHHAWSLYHTICNTWNVICCTPKTGSWILVRWAHVPRKVPKTLTEHDIPRLELCCLNLGILTTLALAWNGILQMYSNDNVTQFWLPGLEIVWSKSWLLRSHMAHVWCVKFL